ncbi:hypothetical protein BD779DRAFT_1508738 [Infundibulicybe gibba]|nr:hypothetical protein BD779DRAFT_1508738 [Infundibulicybe gibba]
MKTSGTMLTDAELEAEAERERDRSRREAERILTREAQERKLVEERVLAMMESTRPLPPPPSRSQTTPNPPSPSNSQKENSWWATAKNKLTPTKEKEPLTPAQQIIHDAKMKEKKGGKGKEKEQEKDKERSSSSEWPANTQRKYSDPAFLNLNLPVAPPQRRPVPASPSSPTPSRPNLSNMAPNLSPSPMRSTDGLSPSREAPPVYAQFNAHGALDVPGTLLMIAKRFEKLEKWTVGHVRALEERMSDVERWLVDKEKEKEKEKVKEKADPAGETSKTSDDRPMATNIQEIRDDVVELQGRVGELVSVASPTTSSIVVHGRTTPPAVVSPPHHPPVVSTPHHPRLPPMASHKSSGTRLPYPTGDYASPPEGAFSPTSSPPSPRDLCSHSSASLSSGSSSSSGIPRATSPRAISPNQNLPPPKSATSRPTSVSPTPRKRYTVALGGPIVAPPEFSEPRRTGTPVSFAKPQSSIDTAFFSNSAQEGTNEHTDDTGDEKDEFQDETIGKSSSAKFASTMSNGDSHSNDPSPSSLRIRAQSVYGFSTLQPPQTPITPLIPRLRSRSTDRFALGENTPTAKFVDPLVLRKQDKEGTKIAMPKPVGKIPIGQLVAFFDGDKR